MIKLGDGIDGLKSLAPGSVNLVFSDLPSGETKADFDIKPDLNKLWPAVWSCLSDTGVVCFMASSLKFAAELVASQPLLFKYDLIWHKSLATGHLNANKRPLRAHEFILIFSKNSSIYNPQMVTGASPIHAARRKGNGENYGVSLPTESRAGATDRFPTSVLEFSSVGTSSKDRIHPQQKPVDLLRWVIRTYSNVKDTVVDPYAGSGSTGIAAKIEDRLFYGWDNNERFAK